MGDIKIGNSSITLKLGSSAVTAAYLGNTLVYSGGTPPTPTYKYIATYTGGITSSADCDYSSSIEDGDIKLPFLVSVEIGDCVTTIGDYAFNYCSSLTSVTIPDSVTSIGNMAFNDCESLTSCTIGSGVTSIGEGAFVGCTSLTSIGIPSGVTSIGDGAFYGCSNLISITVNAITPPTLGMMPFDDTNDCPIYVPCESVNVYKTASGWSDYASRITCIQPPTPTLQWVTFSNGDTIPSDLQIYGIKGIVNDLNMVFSLYTDDIYVENAGRNKFNVLIGGYINTCYNEEGILSNTSVEYTFSNIGCSDYYTVSSKTIANMSNDIQLYIYA